MMFAVLVLPPVVLIALILAQRSWHYMLLRMKRLQGHNKPPEQQSMLHVVFLHPDLGLGGAERLVVDAVVGLQSHQDVSRRVQVSLVTNHHDPKRAFLETRNGTIDVIVRGSWFPRHVLHRGLVLCATVRMLIAATITCVLSPRTDTFVVDQVSAAVPVLKLLCPASSVLFYCHYPDQLCDPSRAHQQTRSVPHRLYRYVFDAVEVVTMRFADAIVCNSKFSRSVTVATFPALANRIHPIDDIFYPPICVESVTAKPKPVSPAHHSSQSSPEPFTNMSDAELERVLLTEKCVVSINRYERKKHISLALNAFAKLLERHQQSVGTVKPGPMRLIVAGGYDPRLAENVAHHEELVQLASTLGIADRCIFLRSIAEATKHLLLSHARCIVYTPSGEHFGIVPIEAMAFGRVVVAVNDGGPLESVTTADSYGFLRPADPEAFAEVLHRVMVDDELVAQVGRDAKKRCQEEFSLRSFSTKLMKRLLFLRKNVTDRKLKLGAYSLGKLNLYGNPAKKR